MVYTALHIDNQVLHISAKTDNVPTAARPADQAVRERSQSDEARYAHIPGVNHTFHATLLGNRGPQSENTLRKSCTDLEIPDGESGESVDLMSVDRVF